MNKKHLFSSVFTAMLTAFVGLALLYSGACKGDNPCEQVVCKNGACVDGLCVCPEGYYGEDCGLLVRDQFLGTYDVQDTCASSNYTYVITISASPANITEVIVSNMVDFGYNFTAKVSGNTLTLGSTQQGLTLNGTGVLNGTKLKINYLVSGAYDDSCVATAIKR